MGGVGLLCVLRLAHEGDALGQSVPKRLQQLGQHGENRWYDSIGACSRCTDFRRRLEGVCVSQDVLLDEQTKKEILGFLGQLVD